MTPNQAAFVLRCYQDADLYESLMWRVGRKDGVYEVQLFANCSDFFFWATADCEEIVPDDFPLLAKTLADLVETDAAYSLPELFCARKRGLRPMKEAYEHLDKQTHPLFDACCTPEHRADADKKDADFWISLAHSQRKLRGRK